MPRAFIGLGANVGDPIATIREAVERLRGLGDVAAVSSLYRTPAWGVNEQPDFVNAAAALDTSLPPYDLLAALQTLERVLGRTVSFRWGPRAIDLDILAYGDVRLADPGLTIPHARLYERAFALVPLAEIAAAFAPARDALPPDDVRAVERIGPLEGEGTSR